MAHSHEHGHHSHDHDPANYSRAFAIGIILNLGFVIVEASYGVLAHSLALLADSGHNLSDVLGLVMAWGASILTRRQPSRRYTYGLRRSSILIALLNAIILLVAMGGISWEAIQRFSNPSPVAGGTLIGVAVVGIVINTATALMFMSGSKGDLNIRGAFLHMAADAMVSVGVVLAGIAIVATGWLWFDPVVSLIIVAVVVVGTWQLLKDSVNLALDAVPEGIEPMLVRTYLAELPGVAQVHDLHIWAMSTTETALTAHLVMPTGFPGDAFLAQTCKQLHDHFGIEHATLQVEIGDPNHPCALAPDHIV
jgi:cobalt-zinc-cadmium efflux system protein